MTASWCKHIPPISTKQAVCAISAACQPAPFHSHLVVYGGVAPAGSWLGARRHDRLLPGPVSRRRRRQAPHVVTVAVQAGVGGVGVAAHHHHAPCSRLRGTRLPAGHGVRAGGGPQVPPHSLAQVKGEQLSKDALVQADAAPQ